jgi:polar amino acid transport system substrate-binding protein
MKRLRRRLVPLAAGLLAAAALAGCGASSDRALHLTLAALATPAPKLAPSTPAKKVTCSNVTASLRPPTTMPVPGRMPTGTFMAQIERRGYLVAGVNAGLLNFGYLNPATGKIEGFEIDLVRELARAIFHDPNRFRLKALTVPQRIPFVQQGKVDIVVDAVTITCARRQQTSPPSITTPSSACSYRRTRRPPESGRLPASAYAPARSRPRSR